MIQDTAGTRLCIVGAANSDPDVVQSAEVRIGPNSYLVDNSIVYT